MITRVIQGAVVLVAKYWKRSQNDTGYKHCRMTFCETDFDKQYLLQIRLRMVKHHLAYEILIKNNFTQNQYGTYSFWHPRKICSWCHDSQFSGRKYCEVCR